MTDTSDNILETRDRLSHRTLGSLEKSWRANTIRLFVATAGFVALLFVIDATGTLVVLDAYRVLGVMAWIVFAFIISRISYIVLRGIPIPGLQQIAEMACGLLLFVFLLSLPKLKTSDFKAFFLLGQQLKECKSIQDPLVRETLSKFRVDKYSEEPRLLRIRFPDPGDNSQIVLMLAGDGKTIIGVAFDPD